MRIDESRVSFHIAYFASEEALPSSARFFGYDETKYPLPKKYEHVPTSSFRGLRGRIAGTHKLEGTKSSADGSIVLMLRDVEPIL